MLNRGKHSCALWRSGRTLLVAGMLAVSSAAAGTEYRTTEPSGWYNTDYIYAATRGLNDSSMHPGAKITLAPVTLTLDTVFLPFALIMGCFGH